MQAICFCSCNDHARSLAIIPTAGASNAQIASHSSQYVCDGNPLSIAD